jgi:hypothetical protein
MKKIAFCFLIYDSINQEELWNLFFQHVDKNMYEIYIHYKCNKPLKYFEKHKLDSCIKTRYADVSLIHAHNLLFKKAYDDGCCKIISLSQACIPFKSFEYIYNFLTKDDFAHFNIASQSQCFPRADRLLNYYDKNVIQKSANWFILNRKTAASVLSCDKQQINNEYGSIYAPEEHYFITNIFYNNLQDELITTPNLANDATTFTNWKDMDYTYPSNSGLKNYSFIAEDELLHLMNSKCLFGRKFNADCITSLSNYKYLDFIRSR